MSKQRNQNAEEFAFREAADLVILEALAESPDRVASAFAKVLERCRASGRYSPEEIDAAASQLSRELGIARRRVWGSLEAATRSRQRYTGMRSHIAWPPASTMQMAAPGDIRLGVATGIWTVLG